MPERHAANTLFGGFIRGYCRFSTTPITAPSFTLVITCGCGRFPGLGQKEYCRGKRTSRKFAIKFAFWQRLLDTYPTGVDVRRKVIFTLHRHTRHSPQYGNLSYMVEGIRHRTLKQFLRR